MVSWLRYFSGFHLLLAHAVMSRHHEPKRAERCRKHRALSVGAADWRQGWGLYNVLTFKPPAQLHALSMSRGENSCMGRVEGAQSRRSKATPRHQGRVGSVTCHAPHAAQGSKGYLTLQSGTPASA